MITRAVVLALLLDVAAAVAGPVQVTVDDP